ncbi:hypothetical protein DOK78_000776 [Enterococcus sp. DIV2402]|jgi:uncharacterized protein YktB (UPF0637 family)|uniref:UPF0637 protein DOK78_000776 n=1 Tax=Candidatus Enterococcus lowellii TaxID=2230877 RepID=A0ABZ2SQL2_9ENTE|nr:DUF1054 domain-containing protein [Enterococcus sp. DIV2402]MBO0465429.1 DUF1054 domain-containing protein [Enterococcus sp. DIV2402]
MFTEKSFAVFEIEGLDERMAAIRAEIQPIFQELNEYFKENLAPEMNDELFIHIAQHRRRSVHPPENTWSAISRKKRGYKMEAHFQLGIFPEYVFMWLSLIDQPKGKEEMAERLLEHPEWWNNLPEDMVINTDHTICAYEPLTTESMEKALQRLKKVKKSELQIGRVIPKESSLWQNPDQAQAYMLETYHLLLEMNKGLQIE